MEEYYLLLIFACIIILILYLLYKYIFKDNFDINKIYEYPNMITVEECKEIIQLADPLVRPSPCLLYTSPSPRD